MIVEEERSNTSFSNAGHHVYVQARPRSVQWIQGHLTRFTLQLTCTCSTKVLSAIDISLLLLTTFRSSSNLLSP